MKIDEVAIVRLTLRVAIAKNHDGTFTVYEIKPNDEIWEITRLTEEELIKFLGAFTRVDVEGRG